MGSLRIFVFVLAALLICGFASAAVFGSGSCPPKHKVHNNKPTCHTDSDCQKYGKICCPNQYNTKSCTDRAPFLTTDSRHKAGAGKSSLSSRAGGPGVYCNGVKCSPWEVCKPDPYTKKLKCQKP